MTLLLKSSSKKLLVCKLGSKAFCRNPLQNFKFCPSKTERKESFDFMKQRRELHITFLPEKVLNAQKYIL